MRKLVYLFIVICFLIGMPIIGVFIDNKFFNIGYLGFIFTIIFVYRDLMITNKAKKL